jgi:putative DNA primase/helicase
MATNFSTQIRAGTVSVEAIPNELKTRPQWVGWRYEARDGKPTKVPYDARTGRRADTTDLLTWCPFEEALDALEHGRFDGIGFVLSSGDSYTGVDLDECREPETGEIAEWAVEIIERLDGYTEVSPSGTGVHVIVQGKAPNSKRGRVEAYSERRFFTITGQALS